jgi:hypothetical protein
VNNCYLAHEKLDQFWGCVIIMSFAFPMVKLLVKLFLIIAIEVLITVRATDHFLVNNNKNQHDCGTPHPGKNGHQLSHHAERVLYGKTIRYVKFLSLI